MLELILHFDRQRYPRLLLTTVYAVCVVVWLAVAEVNAHQLEDGFVERSVAVVVRPGEATVSYSIDANENTRRQLAQSWRSKSETEPVEAWLAEGPVPVIPVVPAQSQSQSQEESEAAFLQAVGDALVRGMAVEADGNRIGLELVEVLPTPRIHVEATVVMRVVLPNPKEGATSIQLSFYDRNFAKAADEQDVSDTNSELASPHSLQLPIATGGAFRYALKGANGAMLNRSTVAPILVRAKRRLVAEIPADELDAEQQFSAEVILP